MILQFRPSLEEIRRNRARPSVVLPEPALSDHADGVAGADLDVEMPSTAFTWSTVRLQKALRLIGKPDLEVVGRSMTIRCLSSASGGVALGLGRQQVFWCRRAAAS